MLLSSKEFHNIKQKIHITVSTHTKPIPVKYDQPKARNKVKRLFFIRISTK